MRVGGVDVTVVNVFYACGGEDDLEAFPTVGDRAYRLSIDDSRTCSACAKAWTEELMTRRKRGDFSRSSRSGLSNGRDGGRIIVTASGPVSEEESPVQPLEPSSQALEPSSSSSSSSLESSALSPSVAKLPLRLMYAGKSSPESPKPWLPWSYRRRDYYHKGVYYYLNCQSHLFVSLASPVASPVPQRETALIDPVIGVADAKDKAKKRRKKKPKACECVEAVSKSKGAMVTKLLKKKEGDEDDDKNHQVTEGRERSGEPPSTPVPSSASASSPAPSSPPSSSPQFADFANAVVICPYAFKGCTHTCTRDKVSDHMRVCAYVGGYSSSPPASSPPTFTDFGKRVVICPYAFKGCTHTCTRDEVSDHLRVCAYVGDNAEMTAGYGYPPGVVWSAPASTFASTYEDSLVMCPYSVVGCNHACRRSELSDHMYACAYGVTGKERNQMIERGINRVIVVREAERERVRRGRMTFDETGEAGRKVSQEKRRRLHELLKRQINKSLSSLHSSVSSHSYLSGLRSSSLLPARSLAFREVSSIVRDVWSGSARAALYGSCATGLDTGKSDVDVVVIFKEEADHFIAPASTTPAAADFSEAEICALPPTLPLATKPSPSTSASSAPHGPSIESRSISTLAAEMSRLPWVKIKAVVEHGLVPVLKAIAYIKKDGTGVVDVNDSEEASANSERCRDVVAVPLDISIYGSAHSGIASTSLIKQLTAHIPTLRPIVLVLKDLLVKTELNDPFDGGLSSYGLVLMCAFVIIKSQRSEGDDQQGDVCQAQADGKS